MLLLKLGPAPVEAGPGALFGQALCGMALFKHCTCPALMPPEGLHIGQALKAQQGPGVCSHSNPKSLENAQTQATISVPGRNAT